MTLKDLTRVIRGNPRVNVTVLAYFKESKKYYSFRTVIDDERIRNIISDEYLMGLNVNAVDFYNDKLFIDLVEFIDVFEEGS